MEAAVFDRWRGRVPGPGCGSSAGQADFGAGGVPPMPGLRALRIRGAAWLFNSKLPGLLDEMGFQCTEDRHRIFELHEGRSVRSPVITWATRTTLLKYGSIAMAPMLGQLWKTAEVLRVAIHPFDLDHDQTVSSIRRLLGSVSASPAAVVLRGAELRRRYRRLTGLSRGIGLRDKRPARRSARAHQQRQR